VNRHNFYVDEERMAMLRKLASVQDASVSDLVREAIDMLLADRMNNPRPSPQERQATFDAFIARYAGNEPERDRADDEAAVDSIAAEHKGRRKPKVLRR
jgi:Arc/MetJ-type ribon-helix-helix transcriptional regulator